MPLDFGFFFLVAFVASTGNTQAKKLNMSQITQVNLCLFCEKTSVSSQGLIQ